MDDLFSIMQNKSGACAQCFECKEQITEENRYTDSKDGQDYFSFYCKKCYPQATVRDCALMENVGANKRLGYFGRLTEEHARFQLVCNMCHKLGFGQVYLTSHNTLLIKTPPRGQEVYVHFEAISSTCTECGEHNVLLSADKAQEVGYHTDGYSVGYTVDNFHHDKHFIESDVSPDYYLGVNERKQLIKSFSEVGRNVYKLLEKNYTLDQIAEELRLPTQVVQNHIKNVKEKVLILRKRTNHLK